MDEAVPVQERSRFSTRVLSGGTEPDPRFTLANERTFRAGGIVVDFLTS
jgi:putative membrane protein